jgi:tetratricopeptide (TPR) repeat protein
VTVGIYYLWLRDRSIDPEEQMSIVARMRGPFASLRSATFVSVLTIAVLGAYAYQQYLWHVALPIPDSAIGIAITRDVAAASFKGELADALFSQGQTQRIVVRELPVNFDASDTGKARELGRRIHAQAVVIYRADAGATDGKGKYAAYVVFTDPEIGLEVGGQPQEASATGADALQAAAGGQELVWLREGVEAPALRTDTLAELVSASAGIIAYHEDRSREAIEQLELALPHDETAAANGIVSFYLGNAYQLDNQDERATTAFERAIDFYERRQAAGPLGPQDELVLLKSYLQRGRIASFAGDTDGALAWYQKGVGLRDDLLARAGDLERPSDVHATFARLYAQLADAYRAKQDTENVDFWAQRAREEAAAIGAAARSDDARAFVEQSSALVFAGDCVGALASIDTALAIDPRNADALFNASIIQYEQGRPDLAEQSLQRVLELRPDDVGARLQLANLRQLRAFLDGNYFEPTYLTQAADLYEDVLKLDPTNLVAHRQLAEMAEWRGTGATFDMTALLSGDAFSVAKSQASWEIDPTRRQAGLDADADAIEQRRVVASELRPDDFGAQLALAYAYFDREKLLYDALYPKLVGGHSELTLDSDQFLSDASEIHKAAEPVLADGSGATRLQQLQAWQVLLQSLDREWGWQAFYLQDQAKTQALADQFRALALQAVASIEAQPLTDPDQQAIGAQIYLMRALVAQVIDNDAQAADDARSKFGALYAQSNSGQQSGTQLAQTLCGEERERVAGQASAAKGDWAGAQTHARAALELNPQHVPSLLDLAAALYQQGDVAHATANAAQAVQLAPDDATALERLALYQSAAGDAAATADDGAWARFIERTAQLPAQERMARLGDAVSDLNQLARQPDQAAAALAAVPLFERATTALPAEAQQSYQAPGLSTQLARVALLAGDAPTAERLLRAALQADPRQPAARALLALAVLAQGHDASAEIAAATAEAQDELWQNSGTPGPADVRNAMIAEITTYVARYPDAADSVQSLRDALAASDG